MSGVTPAAPSPHASGASAPAVVVHAACVPLAGRSADSVAREWLAGVLGVPAAAVRLARAANGRPLLVSPHDPALRVSLAHADGWLALALARGADVGIDLERVRNDVDAEAVVAAAFPAAERARWLASSRTREAFFAAWVRLEALAKAAGCGLPGACDPGALDGITAQALAAPPGFAAAIAVRAERWHAAQRRA